MLLAAATKEELFAEPTGKYVAGAAFVYFCARHDLYGFAITGRATSEGMEKLMPLLEVELGPAIAPHRSIVDARALEGVEAGAFELLAAYVRRHRARLAEVVTRLVVIHPPGFAGATVAGFFHVERAPYPVAFHASPAEALAWLGAEGAGPVLDEVAAIVAAMGGCGPGAAELRAALAARPQLTLAEAAKAMAVSERSLQRRLHGEGTNFATEQVAARIRLAQRLLLDSDASLTRIALDAGWETLAGFSTAFRAATGESPSAWRRQRR